MAVDWLKIRNEYINGGGSYRKLAEKYGISKSTLMQKAAKEKWNEERSIQQIKTEAKAKQKTAEKIAEAAADEAAIKSRIRVKVLSLAEKWLDGLDEVNNMGDFRRMVQNCVDIGAFEQQENPNAQQTEQHSALIHAIREIDHDN